MREHRLRRNKKTMTDTQEINPETQSPKAECNHCGSFARSLLPFLSCSSDSFLSFAVLLHGKCIFLCVLLPLSMSPWSRFEIPSSLFMFPRAFLFFLFFLKHPRKKKVSPSFPAPRRRRSPPPRGFGKKAIKGGRCVLRAPETFAWSLDDPAPELHRDPSRPLKSWKCMKTIESHGKPLYSINFLKVHRNPWTVMEI